MLSLQALDLYTPTKPNQTQSTQTTTIKHRATIQADQISYNFPPRPINRQFSIPINQAAKKAYEKMSKPSLPSYLKDTKFITLATIITQKDQSNHIKSLLLAIQKKALSSEEPGTLSYRVNQSIENPETFVVYEEYENKAALEAHLASEEFKALMDCQSAIISLDSKFLQEV